MVNPIDFGYEKRKRLIEEVNAEGEAQQIEWDATVAKIHSILIECNLTLGGLTSATLRALLDILMAEHQGIGSMTLATAKRHIKTHLKLFFDEGRK